MIFQFLISRKTTSHPKTAPRSLQSSHAPLSRRNTIRNRSALPPTPSKMSTRALPLSIPAVIIRATSMAPTLFPYHRISRACPRHSKARRRLTMSCKTIRLRVCISSSFSSTRISTPSSWGALLTPWQLASSNHRAILQNKSPIKISSSRSSTG